MRERERIREWGRMSERERWREKQRGSENRVGERELEGEAERGGERGREWGRGAAWSCSCLQKRFHYEEPLHCLEFTALLSFNIIFLAIFIHTVFKPFINLLQSGPKPCLSPTSMMTLMSLLDLLCLTVKYFVKMWNLKHEKLLLHWVYFKQDNHTPGHLSFVCFICFLTHSFVYWEALLLPAKTETHKYINVSLECLSL